MSKPLACTPQVSIIIPTRNRVRYLREAIDSVRVQTFESWEVVIVDDGSTDGTAERLRTWCAQDARLRAVSGPKRGAGAARNVGIERARGEYVAFLDDDDVWKPKKLEWQIGIFAKYPEVGVVFTDAVAFESSRTVRASVLPKRAKQFAGWIRRHRRGRARISVGRLDRVLWCVNPITLSTVMIRRSVLEAAGRFWEQPNAGEGYDLWLRVCRLTVAALLDKPTVGYRMSPTGYMGSMEARAFRTREFDASVLENHLEEVTSKLRLNVRARIAEGFRLAGWYRLSEGNRGRARTLLFKSLLHDWKQPRVVGYLVLTLWPAPWVAALRALVTAFRNRSLRMGW